ncbi:nitroreductase/quinone reductase family protein [Streptomyces exfoliatus]|uniref:Nitroreductase/quinone reductase family protein n=1 Tax=Streptomyces exfoliatus TaxID=1905 RepID=A0ABV3D2R8_STREX
MHVPDGNAYVLTASTAGADRNPAWFLNLPAAPESPSRSASTWQRDWAAAGFLSAIALSHLRADRMPISRCSPDRYLLQRCGVRLSMASAARCASVFRSATVK